MPLYSADFCILSCFIRFVNRKYLFVKDNVEPSSVFISRFMERSREAESAALVEAAAFLVFGGDDRVKAMESALRKRVFQCGIKLCADPAPLCAAIEIDRTFNALRIGFALDIKGVGIGVAEEFVALAGNQLRIFRRDRADARFKLPGRRRFRLKGYRSRNRLRVNRGERRSVLQKDGSNHHPNFSLKSKRLSASESRVFSADPNTIRFPCKGRGSFRLN